MSTSTIVPLAYRCTKCWQMTCAGSDQIGKPVPCISCSSTMDVPQATEKSIKAGQEYAASLETKPQEQIDLNSELTDEQIYKMASEKVAAEMKENGTIESKVCSRWKRFFGSIIDSIAGVAAVLGGIFVATGLQALSGDEEPSGTLFIVMVTIPLMFGIIQCYLIATEGRSLGKYCVKSKIVNLQGNPPGFFQGIIMRSVVVGFLGMIPFFNLVNICWIFNEPKRCLHDYIAGTVVIDA